MERKRETSHLLIKPYRPPNPAREDHNGLGLEDPSAVLTRLATLAHRDRHPPPLSLAGIHVASGAMRTFGWVLLTLPTFWLLLACDDESELSGDTQTPVVGLLELPLSHRASSAAPANAARIELAPRELRLEYETVLELERGVIPHAQVQDHLIGPLRERLAAGPARSAALIRLHANTPFQTLTDVLATLYAASIRQVAFEVRPVANQTSTGYLVLDQFELRDEPEEPITFDGPRRRRWSEFVTVWEAAYEGCQRDHYVDCAPVPVEAAVGGDVAITLFSRGSALKAEFEQVGGEEPVPSAEAAPALLDGVPAPVGEAEPEGPPPADHATFTWRFEAATADLSPVKDAFRPLCGARPCGVTVTGDTNTLALRLLSFLGAAFPDGTEAPATVFIHPSQ